MIDSRVEGRKVARTEEGAMLKSLKAMSAVSVAAAASYAAWMIVSVVADTSGFSPTTGMTGNEIANLAAPVTGTYVMGKALEHVARLFG